MWEAVAADGQLEALLAWVRAHAAPGAQIYASADARVVVIDPGAVGLPEVPEHLAARPPHCWPFDSVPR
jgi:hypothetical protein